MAVSQGSDRQKARLSSGVIPYPEMGFYDADYQPKDTDILAAFRVTPQPGVARRRPAPASRPRRRGRSSGPTA